ncbi:MAG: DUF1800 domain-containing protein [Gammaproteobacteria bacterium]
MRARGIRWIKITLALLLLGASNTAFSASAPLPALDAQAWNIHTARHLLERAGFGGTPSEISALHDLGLQGAVDYLVNFVGAPAVDMPPFDHSGIFDEGLDPFPPSRPATTALAEKNGEVFGIKVKPDGNRPMQAIVNKFFYWLRASRLETDRVAYWWAERMLISPRPLEEKMALFWHGHFATNEDKVRDYRKMHKQLTLFQSAGLGNFRDLLIAVAQDPAMLAFLDAGVNVKGKPNENFAREIMELFTMGVGNYTEHDIREAARAFTGWNFKGIDFHINAEMHDDGTKEVLGQNGHFDGVEVIDIILKHPATANFIASKIYRFYVSQDLDDQMAQRLGDRLRDLNNEIQPFVSELFRSQEFYAERNIASHIKGPVEFVISTYKKIGLDYLPGAPDFNLVTGALGQRLMHPPTVAGWSEGRSWITPGLLIERGNFILDVVLPDIAFIPQDRYPVYPTGPEIRAVHKRLRAGMDMTTATRPADDDVDMDMMAMSSQMADRDEAFNTRYASYRGWQTAIERVKPIPRRTARLQLTEMVMQAKLQSPREVVKYLSERFISVPLDDDTVDTMAAYLTQELGTEEITAAETYMEEPLRVLLHMILSRPEYQLG